MACNCKKTAGNAARYSNVKPTEPVGYARGLLNIAESALIVISVSVLIIITLPVSLPIGIVSMFSGKGVRIDRLIGLNREKKQDIQDKDRG